MNVGLVILDLEERRNEHAVGDRSRLSRRRTSRRSCPARDGTIWIGTYGEGLCGVDAGDEHPAPLLEAAPQIADDWILSSCETDRALYFGSFGGGVSVLSKADGSWRRIGIHDGLASLDVPAIAWRPPSVFFGTLGGGRIGVRRGRGWRASIRSPGSTSAANTSSPSSSRSFSSSSCSSSTRSSSWRRRSSPRRCPSGTCCA